MQKKVILITGRTIGQGQSKEYGKLSDEHLDNVALCELDPTDLISLGLDEGDNIQISTNFGSVILKAIESTRTPHKGIIFVPYGIWINLVVDPETNGTGMPSFKGIEAEIQPALKGKILSIEELIEKYYKKV